MNEPKDIITIARLLLLGYTAFVAVMIAWSFRGRLPRDVRSRYSDKIVRSSQLPFTEQWRAAVAPGDLPLFVRARTRRIISRLAIAILITYIPLIYVYMQMVAEVWQCHMDSVGGSK
jgi:hypothetical protein